MLTKGIEVMKYVRASAGRAGLSVVFEDSNQPRHDGKTIYLPKITIDTTDEQLRDLMASTDHEVAHDRYSCFEVLKEKAVDPKGILLFVWNFLEDSRINNIEALEYQGFRENYDECSSSIVTKIVAKANKDVSFMSKLITTLIHWDSEISAHNFPMMQLVGSSITPDKKIIDVLNNFSDRLVYCHSILDKRLGTEATYNLAIDILKELGKSCKEEFKKEMDARSSSSGEPVKGDKASEKEKAEGKASGEDKEKSPAESKKEKDEQEYKVITLKLTEEEIQNYSITMPEESEMGKVGINLEPSGSKGRDWKLTDYDKFIIVNYPKNLGEAQYFNISRKFISSYEERAGSKLLAQENFAQQVRRLIQIKAKVQRQYGVKRGKLDQSRLSRICFNAPGFNERVFKNKIENKTLDACISVLVDMSGSMSGDKALYALASTLLLNEVCTTLNIPVEIVGFTDGSRPMYEHVPLMFVYKSFSDLTVNDESIKEYFSCSSSYMVGNPDGENILWAFDRIAKRKEKKKLLIVMSDGSPAASAGYDGLEEFTSKVIKEIEACKFVDIYGLGLCSSAVSEYYKAHSIVTKPEDIPKNLLQLIERKIINV